MPLIPGTRVGPFEILAPLGAGGMGEIYRARDTRLERDVAIKVLPKELSADREGLLRFAQEARAASALNHPNIITIFEIGLAEGSPFIVMELIAGRTLREVIDAGTLTIKKSLDLIVQIAEGLAKAHEANIVHRDLKPENIMVTGDGFAKILDFGLAKLHLPGGDAPPGATPNFSGLTQAGFVLGTPAYMSPEQASGKPVDFRSDQFAAGVIFYEMLTKRRAFLRATAVQTLSAVIQDDPDPIERLNPRVPSPLRWAVGRCLSKDPEERYSHTRDLARELKQIKDNLSELVDAGDQRLSNTSSSVGVDGSVATARLTGSGPSIRTTRTGVALAVPEEPPPPAEESPAPRSRFRRPGEFLFVLLIALVLFAGGALTGVWFQGKQSGAPPSNWKADLLLGPTNRVLAQRASPDGQALAFVTLVGGASQVAVMKPSSGDWTVLTRRRAGGSVYKVCWSRDGNKILFDRVGDVPLGIFSVPPLGGEERLLLEDAQGPEALPDGSLLVVKRDASRNFQLQRFWPDTGKLTPIGPAVVPESVSWSVRAFPDGSSAVFWGRLAGGKDKGRHVYRLDLTTGRATPFSQDLPLAPPITVAPDGKSVLAFLITGDLQHAVSVSPDGNSVEMLFPVTGKAWQLDASSDGSIYVDTMDNPAELLRFPSAGGAPERIASTTGNLVTSPVQFLDGTCLVPTQVLGRRRLLLAGRDGELRSFLDAAEQATPPVAVVGDRLAFLSGSVGKPPLITIASQADGRIVKRLEASAGASPQSLTASPDGRTLYYIDGGSLFAIDLDGGAPRKLRAASGVAVDLHTMPPSLVVQVSERDGARLCRTDLAGATEIPIPFQGTLRLTGLPLSGGAVGADGRIAVTVASAESWFREAALLDPVTGAVQKVPVNFEGDIFYPTWTRDGSLLGTGVSIRSSLWRFRAQRQKPD